MYITYLYMIYMYTMIYMYIQINFIMWDYMQTCQMFVLNYIGNWNVFSEYLDKYCRHQFYSEISPLYFDLFFFQDIFAKK